MNTFFKIVAWAGLSVFIIGAIISFTTSCTMTFTSVQVGVDFGHYFAFLFGIVGLVLMLIGVLISKPKYFWLASIIAGLLYIASFFEVYPDFPDRIQGGQINAVLTILACSVLPGLVAIIEGVWLKRVEG